jgi:hypothetical protein
MYSLANITSSDLVIIASILGQLTDCIRKIKAAKYSGEKNSILAIIGSMFKAVYLKLKKENNKSIFSSLEFISLKV